MAKEVTNYAAIRESLSLILEEEAPKRKQRILDSLDDATGNDTDRLNVSGELDGTLRRVETARNCVSATLDNEHQNPYLEKAKQELNQAHYSLQLAVEGDA